MDIIDAIDRSARNFPDKIAHISDIRTLTYRELWERSEALAGYFTERYPGEKSPVALVGHKEPEMLIGLLAGVKWGGPYIPTIRSLPAHRTDPVVQCTGELA